MASAEYEIYEKVSDLKKAISPILSVNFEGMKNWSKGEYYFLFCKPIKSLRNILDVDKEVLVVGNLYREQDFRTVDFSKKLIDEYSGRLESKVFFVVHEDPKGNAKLKKWGREQGVTILPLFKGDSGFPQGGAELLKYFAYDLFSQDPFDITVPVSDDAQFYGRRQEAQELARRLQKGQIRSYLGIRKIGKTSILNRTIQEIDKSYDGITVLIDCQRNAVFGMSAAQLIYSIAITIEGCLENNISRSDVVSSVEDMSLESSSNILRDTLNGVSKPIIIAFDEVDYITPALTTPDASHWKSEFVLFWRNMRAVYQSAQRDGCILSILVCGVSSKWFSKGEIDGVENAALSFIPEEYLGPLPVGAAAAMVKNLGKQAGILFDEPVAEQVVRVCGYMPFWIRKFGSFIHNSLEPSSRPIRVASDDVSILSKKFIAEEGGQISRIAVDHLFRVFPEIKEDALSQVTATPKKLSMRTSRLLQKYGILDSDDKLSGEMITAALKGIVFDEPELERVENSVVDRDGIDFASDGDWSEALAEVARRRNLMEKKLRELIVNYLRFSYLNKQIKITARDAMLSVIESSRRDKLSKYEIENIASQLYWRDILMIISKNWSLFQAIFGDQARLNSCLTLLNDRPDAHAKAFDYADFALYRRELKWLEDRFSSFG